MLLGRTATVLVAVLYNKQKICHGGQIFCARAGAKKQDKIIVTEEIQGSDPFL